MRAPTWPESHLPKDLHLLRPHITVEKILYRKIHIRPACAFASRTPGHAPTFSRVSHIDRYALVAWEAGPSVVRLCGSACLALASIAIASIAPEQSLPSMVIK